MCYFSFFRKKHLYFLYKDNGEQFMLRAALSALCLCTVFSTQAIARDLTPSNPKAPITNILPYIQPDSQTTESLRQNAVQLISQPPRNFDNQTELMCIAVSVYHEARGESIPGQKAVASVILQRALVPHRWGDTPCEVVQPVQFSYLDKNRNFARITDQEAWVTSVRVALTMFLSGPDPLIQGADHYHTHAVDPSWNEEMYNNQDIGFHTFYVDHLSTPRILDSDGTPQAIDTVKAKGFTNNGQVIESRASYSFAQLQNNVNTNFAANTIPSTRAQSSNPQIVSRNANSFAVASVPAQASQSVSYDWSGTGVPQKVVRQNMAVVATRSEAPQTSRSSFQPVRGMVVAQQQPEQKRMGLPASGNTINGRRMGIIPPN
jgi:spore germination cell wall hydrolase CwlJ-like protein